MKKILIFLFLFLITGTTNIYAQTKVPSSSDLEKITNRVDQLKNKVASRVAELKLVERRGIVGIVEDVSENQITVNDLNNKRRIIEVDELTKFSSEDNDTYGISDIKKGSKISALGLYNKESQKLLARFVNEISIPLFLHGVITEKDDEEFTLKLLTEEGKNYTVDVERITKSYSYNDGELDTSGFSKIETMKNIILIGFPDPKKNDRLTASRLIIFPDVPKNPNIPVIENDTRSTPTPSPDDK